MSREEHHMLCLGVMAECYWTGLLPKELEVAISEGVESAEKIGVPVSASNLWNGLPIAINN